MNHTLTTCIGFSALALLASGFFAMLYRAFRQAGEAGVIRLKERYPKAAARLERWERHWSSLNASLLICAFLLEITAIALGAQALQHVVDGPFWKLLFLLALALSVFLLALRILPDALSEAYADRLTIRLLPFAAGLARLLWPLAWPIAWIERLLFHRVIESADDEDRPSPEDEIRSLVDQADEEDLEEEEREIIRSVFRFGETVTREIMTPRIDIAGIEDDLSAGDCLEQIQELPHSRFPVYHETMDHILGIVHVKDLLRLLYRGRAETPIAGIIKEVPFVPETMPINDLLTLLRTEQAQLAVVVDEYGGTAGLVTMEDIVEELVGDIQDEYDAKEQGIHRLPDQSWIVQARLSVDEINERLNLNIPESDEYDSIGGYLFQQLGRIPRPGESLVTDAYTITVQAATPRRLHSLRIIPAA